MWDELFTRHQREREELLRWQMKQEETKIRLKRSTSLETIRYALATARGGTEPTQTTGARGPSSQAEDKGKVSMITWVNDPFALTDYDTIDVGESDGDVGMESTFDGESTSSIYSDARLEPDSMVPDSLTISGTAQARIQQGGEGGGAVLSWLEGTAMRSAAFTVARQRSPESTSSFSDLGDGVDSESDRDSVHTVSSRSRWNVVDGASAGTASEADVSEAESFSTWDSDIESL